jgi:Xaa-Pro aminopeptidase
MPHPIEVPGYTLRERDRRWAIVRQLMADEGLDALLVHGERGGTGPAPFCFDVWLTNDRPGTTVVFPRKGDPVSLVSLPMYFSDHFESSRRGDVLWMAPEQMRFPRAPPMVAQVLKEMGAERGTIGIVGAEPYPPFYFVPPLPMALGKALATELPHATVKPVAHLLAGRLFAQSDEELAVIRYAAAIGDAMAEAMLLATRPGVLESEIYAAGMGAAQRRGIAAPGMLLWSGREFVAWGPPAWTYRPQAPRVIEEGDVVLAEVFVQFGMKETQHQVAIAVGDVHPDFRRAFDVARAAYDSGLEMLRPGRRFGEVADAMRRRVEEGGGSFVHPVLHGLNPFGTVSAVSLAIGKLAGAEGYHARSEIPPILYDLVLEKGMTFAFEPNCVFGRRTANLGGTVIVGDDAPVELNPRTARLLHARASG